MQETLFDITITDIAYGGDGVGKLPDGMTIFVPFAAAEDQLRVVVTDRQKRFARGEIREILVPGRERTEPFCPYYGRCGGCTGQHLTPTEQLRLKAKQLIDQLQRIAEFQDIPVIDPIVQGPNTRGYRNKLVLHPLPVDGVLDYGFVDRTQKTVLPIDTCPLAMEAINEMIPKIPRSKWGKHNVKRDEPRQVTLRTDHTGTGLFFFGRPPRVLPWFTQDLNGKPIRVPASSFHQVNPGVAGELTRWVHQTLSNDPSEYLVDAYCGVGVFALLAAEFSQWVYGIESDSDSVKAASHNAREWGYENIVFARNTVEAGLEELLFNLDFPEKTTILLDPPRNGCKPEAADQIRKFGPAKIIYISCNPSTLARDLKRINAENTYRLTTVGCFDMFPHTAHFEAVAVLERIK